MPQYLSTDPHAGASDAHGYVSTDPNAGAETTGAHEPETWLGGFFNHLLTKEKPAVAALAGIPLALGGAAGVVPAAAVNAGFAAAPTVADAASRAWKWLHGEKQDPITGGEVFEDAMGPATVYGPGAAIKGAKYVASSPRVARMIGAGVGAATGSPMGHPVIGALVGEREAGPVVQRLAELMGSIKKSSVGQWLTDPADAAASTVERYMPNRGRVSREVSGFRMPDAPVSAEPLPRSSLADVDRYMPNVSTAPAREWTPSYPDMTPAPRPAPTAAAPRVVGKAPTLEGSLQQALDSVRGDTSPVTASSGKLADTPEMRLSDPRLHELFRDEVSPRGGSVADLERMFADEAPVRQSTIPRAEPTPSLPPEFHAVGDPAAPQAKVDQAVQSLTGDSGPSYTKWADEMDAIINATTSEDLAQFPSQPSRPTKAWRDFILKRQVAPQ